MQKLNMMTSNVEFLDDEELIKELSSFRYRGGNIGLAPDASLEERTKYRLCKTILAYQQDNKLSIAEAAKKLAISEKKFYEIGRGNIDRFSLEELLFHLEKIAPNCELGIIKNSEYPKKNVRISWRTKV